MHFPSSGVLRPALLALACAGLLAACRQDEPTLPRLGSPAFAKTYAERIKDSVQQANRIPQAAINDLTLALALSLRDEGLRQHVKNDLRNSRFTREHKLDLSSYLHGEGGILLAKMALATSRTKDDLFALLSKVRPLELYMPVQKHRESWTGGPDLIVASQLLEWDAPVAYHLDGSPADLSLDQPPETPVLVLVPAEADFTAPLPAQIWQNVHDAAGQAIGTYELAAVRGAAAGGVPDARPLLCTCDDCPTQPGCEPPPLTAYPAGLYLRFAHIDDLGESWPRGDPEIEVHLIGPTAFPGNDGEHLSCSGQNVSHPKWFDQNEHDWVRDPYAPVHGQLFSESDIRAYYANYNPDRPFAIQLWEDDNQSCVIVFGDRTWLQGLADNLRGAYNVVSFIIRIFTPEFPPVFRFDYSVVAAFRAATTSDDDPIGQLVPDDNIHNYADATHVIMKIARDPITGAFGPPYENGRVALELRSP